MSEFIAPGSIIGIVGGGQLGRMSAMAAAHMGYKCHIYTPEEDSPASHVAAFTTVAAYDDAEALKAFAKTVDVVTFEFENVPAESLELMAEIIPVHPSIRLLRTCRHRLREKTAINEQGIATAPFASITSLAELESAIESIGTPCVLKTCQLGYDGKGQFKIDNASQAREAWEALGGVEAILEGWVPFEREISVIVARNASGHTIAYEPAHNIHKNHILSESVIPCGLGANIVKAAQDIAHTLAEALDLIGIMAVELFVTESGDLIVNELAPRPHNSGHWTIEAASTSQFEQHIRAVVGMSLGCTRTLSNVSMINLIGDDVDALDTYYANPKAHVHLYGKREARAGRKMGHVTILKD
ncbi:MAG: 5-(carboxyamino)imidazole ribonucleotide synthase [Rickettsiales bacterium]|nr:5-(carboxyamino)imidazole ribonucleotide synthase [Rickettsiales bacterium]